MLSDQEIEKNAKQLADYKRNDALPDILERYAALIDDYRRLKSDYEEEREGRERYKQLARGQGKNPLVLVLVDGDGYIFEDDLIRDGADGGTRAAKRLSDAVEHSLRRKGIEKCDVIIRVYANLVGLSKALYKAGLCGAEKRSLAPFTAGFNRAYGLSDFVDAGELKENADFKLRAMLDLYAENSHCKHIYLAACHDVGYVSELTPYRGNRDKFTLLSTPSLHFHNEFHKLGMNIEELPGVFRTTPLDVAPPYRSGVPLVPNKSVAMATHSQPSSSLPNNDGQGQKICQFFQVGKCKYGKACKNYHPEPRPLSFHSNRASRSESDFGSNGGGGGGYAFEYQGQGQGQAPAANPPDPAPYTKNEFHLLPRNHEIPRGYVAVNQNQHRLDAYIPPPTNDAINRLKARSDRQKLCNSKHLIGKCDNENCGYDHSPITEDLRPALELLSRSMPCPKRGDCRNENCVYGHICQRTDCKHRGGKSFCRISPQMHAEALALGQLIPAVAKRPPTHPANPGPNHHQYRLSPSTDDEVYSYPANDVDSEGEEGAPIMSPIVDTGAL